MMEMPDWLHQRARLSPTGLALVSGGTTRLTYEELDDRVALAAGRLKGAGVGRGDAVAVLAGNSPTFAVLAHAVPRLGAILVPIHTRLTAGEVGYQLDDVRARLVVADEGRAELAHAAGWADRTLPADALLRAEAEVSPFPAPGLTLSDARAILYTSGTTGRPKGTILTHGNFWHSAVASALNLGHHADDRWLAVLPLFHVGGLSILYRAAIYGIPTILHERFDEIAVNRALDEEGVTIVSLVSTMLRRLLDARQGPFPPSLRCVLLGGGPAPYDLLARCADMGVPVVQTYGMTETTSQAATLAPAEALARLGSAGKPLMGVDLRIDVEGRQARADEEGEIVVRGPVVSQGYFGRPEETRRAIQDGWLHTGDIGRIDAEGYLYVLDRRSDLIVTGGENVYPVEVEAVLQAHPAVAEAAVFGVPDDRWGQAVTGAIVAAPDSAVDEGAILRFCRERLAAYKVPRRLLRRESLPRNAGGKLMRRALREEVLAQGSGNRLSNRSQ